MCKIKHVSIFIFFILMCRVIVAQDTSFRNQSIETEKRIEIILNQLSVDEKISMLKHDSPANERLGIPAYNWWNEGLHGVARFGRATVFPQPIAMAATFNPALVYEIAEAVSLEARAKHHAAVKIGNFTQYSGLTLWSPNINIFRDPRWGRGMETFGEDPFLTALMGVAYVKGLQGDHPYYYRTAACAKHLAVHSGPESERHSFDAYASPKDLYETYLPAFEAVTNAGVASVMCGYNRLNGEPCCASNFLINDMLIKKWNFKGQIVSDCWSVTDFHAGHKVTENVVQSAALALKSGVDMNCGDEFPALKEALKQGLVTESDIDKALRSNLRMKFRLGLFDEQHPYRDVPPSIVAGEKHKALARKAAQQSIVLLKNKNILPLSKTIKHLYVLGPNAADVDVLLGNYNGQTDEARTFLEGITAKVDLGTRLEYRRGFMYDQMNRNDINWAMTEAMEADVVIAVVGLSTLSEGEEGEAIASDYKSDRRNLSIPETQMHYLRELRSRVKKPLVVVVTGGSPVDLTEISEMADALLFSFYPGQAGGDAMADVLFGDVSPSGKLPITFPKSESQLPDYSDYSMVGRTYKYMTQEPQYPFGFGLTYATFELGEIKVNQNKFNKNDTISLEMLVANTSEIVADEVLQLYVQIQNAPFRVPLYDLKNTQRHGFAANQTKRIYLKVPVNSLSTINEKGDKVLLKGNYKLFWGTALPTKRSKYLGSGNWQETSISVK